MFLGCKCYGHWKNLGHAACCFNATFVGCAPLCCFIWDWGLRFCIRASAVYAWSSLISGVETWPLWVRQPTSHKAAQSHPLIDFTQSTALSVVPGKNAYMKIPADARTQSRVATTAVEAANVLWHALCQVLGFEGGRRDASRCLDAQYGRECTRA